MLLLKKLPLQTNFFLGLGLIKYFSVSLVHVKIFIPKRKLKTVETNTFLTNFVQLW